MILSCEKIKEHYPTCISCSKASKIQVKENKRTYILNNLSGKEICKARIDGGLISSDDKKKCDFAVIVCETNDIYFVELKGRDFLRAVEQLSQTIRHFQSQFEGKVFARIVLSKVASPRVIQTDAKVLKLRRELKKYEGTLEYGSRIYEKDSA